MISDIFGYLSSVDLNIWGLRKQMEEVQSQEEALQRLQEQVGTGTHLHNSSLVLSEESRGLTGVLPLLFIASNYALFEVSCSNTKEHQSWPSCPGQGFASQSSSSWGIWRSWGFWAAGGESTFDAELSISASSGSLRALRPAMMGPRDLCFKFIKFR